MPVGAMAGATALSAGATAYAADRSADATSEAASRADRLEREKFNEAKRQAEILRERGDEAAAQAMEEAARADLGAQRYEDLAFEYGDRADQSARFRQEKAANIYDKIQTAAQDRMAAGEDAATAIRGAAQDVQEAAGRSSAIQSGAFGNIRERYSPFLSSEQQAAEQLAVEQGLAPGETERPYRETPAFEQAMEASRVAEEDAIGAINQDAANRGTLYSGRRGEALVDRSREGSYERAGIEQKYYQNYMNMLDSMANPNAAGQVSQFEASTARNVGQNYLDAAQTGVGAEQAAQEVRLSTMPTGAEGQEMLQYIDPGTAGAQYKLGGMASGTEGSDYRLQGQDYRMQGAGSAGQTRLSSFPTGNRGSQYRMQGVQAQNAALADFTGGVNQLASTYYRYGDRGNGQNAFMDPNMG